MSKLRVHAFSISLDGYGAGPDQDASTTRSASVAKSCTNGLSRRAHFSRCSAGRAAQAAWTTTSRPAASTNIGAWILGRNMFGPVRGPWPDENWKGWWGDNPPYHCRRLRPHPPSARLDRHGGGTTFHFVTDGIHAALERATDAAGGKDIRLGGGVATIRQYLSAGLIDEMHLAIAPVLLGCGEHLLAGIDLPKLGYGCAEHVPTPGATHVVLKRQAS